MDPNKLGEYIDQITQRLSPAGKVIWEAAIRHTIAESIASLALIVLGLILGLTMLIVGYRHAEWQYGTTWEVLTIFGGVLSLIAIVFVFVGGATLIPDLIAPEYRVITNLLNAAP